MMLDIKPEPVPETVRSRLVRLLGDCSPPVPIRVQVTFKYDRGAVQTTETLYRTDSPSQAARAFDECLRVRSRELGNTDDVRQDFTVTASYLLSDPRMPFPIPTPSGPVQSLGGCDDQRLGRIAAALERRGYRTRSFRFLDGAAIATTPEQLDTNLKPLAGAQRYAELRSNCWDRYQWFDGLSCLLTPPAERVRSFAFLCASGSLPATMDYPAQDPAMAVRDLTVSGSVDILRMPDDAPRSLHLAEYRYMRGPAEEKFHLEKGLDTARDNPLRGDEF